ncbi:MAG: NAD(P)H-dependent flavin oxidoreductase, partial [Burkholderiales bacterium]
MLHTRVCDLFGVELPIVSAGMGGVAGAELAAAVSNAGGLGTVALAGLPPAAVTAQLRSARALTAKPLVASLLIPFMTPEVLSAALAERISAVWFFWGEPAAPDVAACHQAGVKVIWQCGSVDEAVRARSSGVDCVIAQGFEAGGHVRGTTTTVSLLPAVRDAIGDLPLLAAGGLADGRGLAAALALGADGAVFGTRFIASAECAAHPDYKRRILAAHAEDTLYTTLFDIGWPDAPHRVLRTELVQQWERAGRPASGQRPAEGEPGATMHIEGAEMPPLVSYSIAPPSANMTGHIERHAFYAGQSVDLVNEILPAADIVHRIAREAEN